MVLAAGLGTRLQPYTLNTPKALIPLMGVPSIDFSLMQLLSVGIGSVVVNVHSHSGQMIHHLVRQGSRLGMNIAISDESNLLLGSAGGFCKAVSMIETVPGRSEPFFALNADVVSLVDLNRLAERHRELRDQHGVEMTLCLARGKTVEAQEGSYTEILVDEKSGLITGTGFKKNKVPFYTGTAVFETECFRHLKTGVPSEFVPEVLAPKIAEGKVGFFWMEDLWVDIGSPALWWKSHFILKREFEQKHLPPLWNHEISEKAGTFRISSEEGVVDYDSDSAIEKNSIRFKGVSCAV